MDDRAKNQAETEPLSPCINICTIDPDSGYCRGCLRSVDEITDWMSLSPAAKRHIIADLAKRA